MPHHRFATVGGASPEEALRNKILAENAPQIYARLQAILDNPILLTAYEQAVELANEMEDKIDAGLAEFNHTTQGD